jgi:hypothetical protein
MEDRNTVRIRPPHGQNTTDRNAAQVVATTAASTAVQAVVPAGQTMPTGSGLWITLACDQNFRIRFGTATVGDATTSDMIFTAGMHMLWCHSVFETHFKAIRVSADGSLTWYTSE